MRQGHIDVLVTGPVLVGKGLRSLGTVLIENLNRSKQEIQIAAYVISRSGLEIVKVIERRLLEGLSRAVIVLNELDNQDSRVRNELLEMGEEYSNFYLMDFRPQKGEGAMHAKAIAIDREIAFVGSTNLSFHGLVSGHEIAVQIAGKKAKGIARAIDRLMLDKRATRRGLEWQDTQKPKF